MKYELRLSDMVLQSTAKTAVRQKVDRFFTAGGGSLSVLSDYAAARKMSLTSRLTLLSVVMRRESCPR
jgi:hypothetical protein